MRNFQLPAGVAVCAAVLVLTGCGKPWDSETRSDSEETGNPVAQATAPEDRIEEEDFRAEKLQLALAGAGPDAALPCSSATGDRQCSGLKFTAQFTRNEISIREMLSFNRALFFTFPEAAFPERIVNAYFAHRVQNPENKFSGEPTRSLVSFDPDSRLWFIPVAKLGRSIDHNPVLQQWLRLDLQLAGGQRLEFTVRFRAEGTLPELQLVTAPSAASAHLEEFLKEMPRWLLAREQIRNPANRPVRLWLKSRGRVQAQTVLAFNRFQDRGNAPPSGPHPEYFKSEGALVPGRLYVRRSTGEIQRNLTSDQWVSVELAPLETVELVWHGVPEALLECHLPAAATRTAFWETKTSRSCRRGDCMGGETYDHSTVVTETWALAGAALRGAWFREIRVSSPYIENRQLLEPGASSILAGADQIVSIELGRSPEGLVPFACQGFF